MLLRLVVLAAVAVAGACSASHPDEPIGMSGLPNERRLYELTDAELRQLCEWQASLLGEPGSTTECEGGKRAGTPTVDACVSAWRTTEDECRMTVRQREGCVLEEADDPCVIFTERNCGRRFCMPES
jgi:hypothetical protein